MSTTKEDIRNWLAFAKQAGATHMLVVCDTWDYEDHPVYVSQVEDVHKVFTKHSQNMQKVMECYKLDMDLETQLNERRAMNF